MIFSCHAHLSSSEVEPSMRRAPMCTGSVEPKGTYVLWRRYSCTRQQHEPAERQAWLASKAQQLVDTCLQLHAMSAGTATGSVSTWRVQFCCLRPPLRAKIRHKV